MALRLPAKNATDPWRVRARDPRKGKKATPGTATLPRTSWRCWSAPIPRTDPQAAVASSTGTIPRT